MSHDPNDCYDFDGADQPQTNAVAKRLKQADAYNKKHSVRDPLHLEAAKEIGALETMLSDLNALCNEVGVRGGENRVAGLRRMIDEQHDALWKMVRLYESEYDCDASFIRPDWLRSALWEDRL
jgi:hypothetical protein